MNPALPTLLFLSLLPVVVALLRRRRPPPAAVAAALLGLAGMALLAGALAISDGVPSPAATLGSMPPWQGVADPSTGNPNLRDVTHQIQPWLLFLRHELRAGRLPFWNPHQFAGAPFWANGQSAPLFPLHLVFAALPLQLGFVVLPWLRFVIAGFGTWLLARRLGLSSPGALAAALLFPLSGMLVCYLLFPMGNALALVPWVFWATERLASGEGSWRPLALLAGLQALGGHPETSVHTALLTTLYLAIRGAAPAPAGPPRAWPRFVTGWIVAALFGAVQLLPLALNVMASTKWLEHENGGRPPLGMVLKLMLRIAWPELYGNPVTGSWFGPFDYASSALYVGAATLPLAVIGLAAGRRDRRLATLGILLAFCLVVAFYLPGLSDLLRALPGLSRVLHHRLIFGVELTLALLAGAGWDRWSSARRRGAALVGAGLTLVLVLAGALAVGGEWRTRELGGAQLLQGGLLLATALLLILNWPLGWRRRVVWLLPPILALDLLSAHRSLIPGLPRQALYPRTPMVDFLDDTDGRIAGIGWALHPNAAMVYGLYDLRGDDPVKAALFEEVYRRLAPADAVFFRPIEQWGPEALFDRLSIRWIVAAPGERPRAESWRLAYAGEDGVAFERPSAWPLVRQPGGDARGLVVEGRRPGHWRIRVSAQAAARDRRIEIGELWDAGWRGRSSLGRLAIHKTEDHLLSVDPPPGAEWVEITYRPAGWRAGVLLSLGAALLLGLPLWRRARRLRGSLRLSRKARSHRS